MDMFCTTDNNRNGRIWSTGAAADDDNPNRIEREREREWHYMYSRVWAKIFLRAFVLIE